MDRVLLLERATEELGEYSRYNPSSEARRESEGGTRYIEAGGAGSRQAGGKMHKVGGGIGELVRSTCDAHAAHPTKHAGYLDVCVCAAVGRPASVAPLMMVMTSGLVYDDTVEGQTMVSVPQN